jgi:hypothetical protein
VCEIIIDTTDIFGKRVILERDTWDTHIVGGHDSMRDKIPVVKASLEQPTYVIQDVAFATRTHYISPEIDGQYIKTVVEDSMEPSRVVTAYPITRKGFGTTEGVIYDQYEAFKQ